MDGTVVGGWMDGWNDGGVYGVAIFKSQVWRNMEQHPGECEIRTQYCRSGGGRLTTRPPRWPSGKASASRAEGPGFESRLRRDFFGVESYQ